MPAPDLLGLFIGPLNRLRLSSGVIDRDALAEQVALYSLEKEWAACQ